jgi:signal transduction histidine kinase
VVRHGVNVDEVKIAFCLTESSISISITDNGTDAGLQVTSPGLGMESMQGRAISLGGVLRTNATANGFEVQVELPIERISNRQFAQ